MAVQPVTQPRTRRIGGFTLRWIDSESVALEGTVHSFDEHIAALRVARASRGVRRVVDDLTIRLSG
jgi:hypothetical protein